MVMRLSEMYTLEEESQSGKLELKGRTRMEKLAYAVNARQNNEKDAWILVTGDLGDGKSTLSIELLSKLSKLNGFKWSLKNNILFNPDYEEINERIHKVAPRTTLVVDEAAKILHARNWNTADQIQFGIMGERVRFRELCIIFNIRMMKEVDLLFRVGRFFYWIDILKRGTAAIFARTAGYNLKTKGDAYNTDVLYERLEGLDNNDIGSKMAVYESMPNFRGFMYFPALSPRIANAYKTLKELSDNQQYEKSKEVEMTRQQKEAVMVNLILELFQKGASIKEIAESVNRGNPEKPITEYKIKRIITKARRSVEGVADTEITSMDKIKTEA